MVDVEEAGGLASTAAREALRRQGRRGVVNQPGDARRRTQARAGSRGLLRADGSRLASNCATKGSGRERDTGARITGPRRATSRGRPQAPDVCSLTRHRLAPTPQPTTHKVDRQHAGSRRCPPRTAKPPNLRRSNATRPKLIPPQPRPAALGAAPATEPPSEINPKVCPTPLDFHPSSVPGVRSRLPGVSAMPGRAAVDGPDLASDVVVVCPPGARGEWLRPAPAHSQSHRFVRERPSAAGRSGGATVREPCERARAQRVLG